MRTRPVVGLSSPVRILSKVVFPEPERPRNAINSPGRTPSETPRSARTTPPDVVKSRETSSATAIATSTAILFALLACAHRPWLDMILQDARLGASIEGEPLDGFARQLQTPTRSITMDSAWVTPERPMIA